MKEKYLKMSKKFLKKSLRTRQLWSFLRNWYQTMGKIVLNLNWIFHKTYQIFSTKIGKLKLMWSSCHAQQEVLRLFTTVIPYKFVLEFLTKMETGLGKIHMENQSSMGKHKSIYMKARLNFQDFCLMKLMVTCLNKNWILQFMSSPKQFSTKIIIKILVIV